MNSWRVRSARRRLRGWSEEEHRNKGHPCMRDSFSSPGMRCAPFRADTRTRRGLASSLSWVFTIAGATGPESGNQYTNPNPSNCPAMRCRISGPRHLRTSKSPVDACCHLRADPVRIGTSPGGQRPPARDPKKTDRVAGVTRISRPEMPASDLCSNRRRCKTARSRHLWTAASKTARVSSYYRIGRKHHQRSEPQATCGQIIVTVDENGKQGNPGQGRRQQVRAMAEPPMPLMSTRVCPRNPGNVNCWPSSQADCNCFGQGHRFGQACF